MAAVVDRRALLQARLTPPPFDPTEVWAKLDYEPTDRQRLFHDATEHDVLYGGALGGGKTLALLMDDIADAVHYPGLRVGAFRRSFDELEESFFRELISIGYAEEQLGCRWHETKRELRFPNGSVIRYRYLDKPISASRRQGGQYQKITIDEVTLIDPGAVEVLSTERLRSGSRVPVIGVRASCNPGGVGHSVAKKRYIEATEYGEHAVHDAQGRSIRFIPAKSTDNPHLDHDYIRNLQGISDPKRRAAMVDGDWDSFSGQVFGEWRRDRHVVDPIPLGFAVMRVAGIDYGYRHPFACVWGALDSDGRLWIYRELWATETDEDEQARRILAAEAVDHAEIVSMRSADPSMWAKRGKGPSPAEAYLLENCAIIPAYNDRIDGWQRLHMWLSEAPACHIHRAMGWETCPLTHFFSSCPDTIRTLSSLPYDPHGSEDADTHADDHLPDAIRYLACSLPAPKSLGPQPPRAVQRTVTVMDGVMTADAPSIPASGVRAHDRGRAHEQGISTMSF